MMAVIPNVAGSRDHGPMEHSIGRVRVLVGLLACALGQLGCGDDTEVRAPSEVSVTSKAALYEGTFTASPAVGHNEVWLRLAHADGSPLEGALVASDVWCPEHGHGSGDMPMCSEHGHGSYLVNNVVFTMPGTWDMHVYVSAEAGYDELVVSYDVE